MKSFPDPLIVIAPVVEPFAFQVPSNGLLLPRRTKNNTATTATSTVPVSSPSTPMDGGDTSVRHSVRVRNDSTPVWEMASELWMSRNAPTSSRSTSTEMPAPIVIMLNRRSAALGTSVTTRRVRTSPAG